MSTIRFITAIFILSFSFSNILAQNKTDLHLNEVFSNNEELEALALYPDDIRESILELCLYPELIVKMGVIQSRTQLAFQEIIQDETEEAQRNYWEILRYPGLLNALVADGPKNKKEIETILASYPDEIHAIALENGARNYNTLVAINSIDQEANETVSTLLSSYNRDTKEKVELLLKFPEVLHIMVENIDVAILVGEKYRKDPESVIAKAEAFKLEVAVKHQKDVEDWKKGLEEDPKALQEFEEVSTSFKKEKENDEYYDPLYPNTLPPQEEEQAELQEKDDKIYIEYNYYPYPYWYGYPVWFPNLYWYRYPYWYHMGFYYGSEQSMVILGLPSYYYFYWYFNYPTHYYKYPYLSDYIIRYYRSRRSVGSSRSSLTRSVDYWRSNSRSRIPNSILEEQDDQVRRQKLREYGKFEEDYRRRVQRKPEQTGTHEEYLNKYKDRYQYLSGQRRTVTESNQVRQYTRPQTTIRSSIPSRSLNLNRAREIHQRTWQMPNPIGTRRPTTTSPTRKTSSTRRGGN